MGEPYRQLGSNKPILSLSVVRGRKRGWARTSSNWTAFHPSSQPCIYALPEFSLARNFVVTKRLPRWGVYLNLWHRCTRAWNVPYADQESYRLTTRSDLDLTERSFDWPFAAKRKRIHFSTFCLQKSIIILISLRSWIRFKKIEHFFRFFLLIK